LLLIGKALHQDFSSEARWMEMANFSHKFPVPGTRVGDKDVKLMQPEKTINSKAFESLMEFPLIDFNYVFSMRDFSFAINFFMLMLPNKSC
jgi:hypothetical protein